MCRFRARTWCFLAFALASPRVAARTEPLRGAQNPSLIFSTPITGGQPVRMAVDADGNVYLAGSTPFPNQPAFVTKLSPSRSVVYTTYLPGTRFSGEPGDCTIQIAAIAMDRRGAAYVTGCTTALDFPLVNPLRPTPGGASRGSGFLVKLSSTGAIAYSTYLPTSGNTAIAVDDDGQAYVAGRGFAAKLSASGSSFIYSTNLPAVPNAIAVDRSGAAYFAGTGNLNGSSVRPIQPCHDDTEDVIVIKLNPAGSSYDYATCLGGSRSDAATGIAVDAAGAAYVVGTTSSLDFPTVHPLSVPPRTGPMWKMEDDGATWTNLLVDGYSINPILTSRRTGGTWYAGALYGGFRSDDRGATWQRLGLPLRDSRFQPTVVRLETDSQAAGTVYASTSEGLFKSTDHGDQWSPIGGVLPSAGAWLRTVAVDPADSRIVYAATLRGFWRSVDGGVTWTSSTRGLGTDSVVNALAVDPVTHALYIDVFQGGSVLNSTDRVFISTDAGATWIATPLEIQARSVTALTAVRARPRQTGARTDAPGRNSRGGETPGDAVKSTVYLAAKQALSGGPFGLLLRSDDGGETWDEIGNGLPVRGADALAIAPGDANIVYAASQGPVFVSRDRGNTFQPVPGVSFESVSALAVDPVNAGTVFVGTSSRSDAFIAKISPGGGSLQYSTYLGGSATDRGAGIIIDDFGRAVVFGTTESNDFPDVAAIQTRRGATDAFVAVVDGGGSVLLFSSSFGGAGRDVLVSVAPRGGDVLISGGTTDLGSLFPDSGASGAGAFVGSLNLPVAVTFRTRR